jgi:hypothetical protein
MSTQIAPETRTTTHIDHANRRVLTHGSAKRPSWRRYGSGRQTIDITLEIGGGLSIHATEMPEELRGHKEVFVNLDKDATAILRQILNGEL